MPENNFDITLNGKEITDIPEDLFIPPDALRVILEQFEGPLDLLLYLIKKQNIDTKFWIQRLLLKKKFYLKKTN